MAWTIIEDPSYEQWFNEQSPDLQDKIFRQVELLEERGIAIQERYGKKLKGTKKLFELIVQHKGDPWRILYAFIPEHQIILLVGGNKGPNEKLWYKQNIARAEKLYEQYLKDMRKG